MQRVTRLCLATGFLLLATFSLHAQSGEDRVKAQEDFSLAVATAHARTSLFVAGSLPFAIHASAVSNLALHGTGKGTYENQWVDAQHWHRVIRFADYQQFEMRYDTGHSWLNQSSDAMPLRVSELLRFVVIHLPSSTMAASLPVSETTTTGDQGQALTCYSGKLPPPADGFPRPFGLCFEKASGLLVTEDTPLNRHIVYSNYIVFQGKHEFTHVRVTGGNLALLDIDIQYVPLDSHALDGATPDSDMHRSKSAASTPNPEEVDKGTVEYRFNPPLPNGTPEEDKNKPVQVLFQVSAENTLVDAGVEDAPTQAMGEAALQAARKFTFTPLTVDGKPVGSRFYQSVWFQSGADNASSPGNVAKKQPEGAARPAVLSSGVYRNEQLSFAVHYPAGFEPIPRGELEQELHFGSRTHRYGLEAGTECDTLLFKAQRLRPGQSSPEILSLIDLAPTCIFGLLDHKALESIALNAARSFVDQTRNGNFSEPKQYTMNGRTFTVASASGGANGTIPKQIHVLVVVTTLHDHVLGWTIMGNDVNVLAQTLAACSLQIGNGVESTFFPISEMP
jgi:hypothetical protein